MYVVGTAGHVDHGKSTLVQSLTGIDPDRWAEEKRRGLTIDLGFAWLTTPAGREMGIVDVPGHERFIKNMLAGAGGISVCLFVVAANEGWMPQSAEHLAILDVLGVERGVIALTKTDAVDPETADLMEEETRERLRGTSLAGARIVQCSAKERTGLDTLVASLDEVLAETPDAPDSGRPRLWVDRAFTVAGAGTVVTGTLAEGSFTVGDEVQVAPDGDSARVRSLQTHKTQIERADPGRRLAMNLSGLDRGRVERGDALVLPGTWSSTRVVDAEIRVLPEEVTGARHVLEEKGAHLFYCGTAETPVRISLLTGSVGSGQRGLARLWLRNALPLGRGDRFVLRDAGRVLTFGGGKVLDPRPSARKPARPEHVALLNRLAGAGPTEALDALVEAEGSIQRSEALERSGAPDPGPGTVELGDRLASHEHVDTLLESLVDELRRWHADRPLEAGMPRERARAALGLGSATFDALARRGEVVDEGTTVRLASFGVRLDPTQEREKHRIVEKVERGGFSPPLRGELEAEDSFLRALVEAGDLVPVGDFYLTAELAEEAKTRVRTAIAAQGPLTVAQIRDLLETSRKYAVPLCEWLDASGTTRRKGDVRVLAQS